MTMKNQTTVTEFILLGLSSDPQMQLFLFLVVLVVYLITLSGNIVIMVVIRADSHLHTPMYFFLFHLSFVDICYSSVMVPNMLMNFLAKHKTISVNSCIAQMFLFILSVGADIFILLAIAYDRYAAICDPLHYVQTMRKGICIQLVSGACIMGFFYALLNTIFALKLHFCGPNQISHFSCELPPLLQLSCTETLTNQVMLLNSAVVFGLSSFLLTLISYIHIISTIPRICFVEGRHKAFSMFSSHLIVVGLLYVIGFLQYTKPSSVSSVVLDEMFSIQYSILTPMLNPIVYSLKNKEMKTALRSIFGKFRFLN
ncbi:olfactory receptor 5V1-like [Malaclemys terrapin pileata]|uniref:olfactory receptor 5V1-like n=1 Tax=Malaclemys terrapin pileata TaxID=2991368 RepID=UPI0023A8CDE3|nr:olfactory receptor 5V1-like [Malaclemys terrapin pileata]